jgi:hypothetical protein
MQSNQQNDIPARRHQQSTQSSRETAVRSKPCASGRAQMTSLFQPGFTVSFAEPHTGTPQIGGDARERPSRKTRPVKIPAWVPYTRRL